jgi:hypothetical protein
VSLKALPAAQYKPGTDRAQRYLAGAHDAVEAVLENLEKIRQLRKAEGGDIRGVLTNNEVDMLRAAIVFTGAGVDATLKQLIRDTLPALLVRNDQAHGKFEDFASARLGTGEIADTRMIARYLTSANPRERLIEDYVYDLTGSSLQSADEVQKVAGALGVDDKDLRKRIWQLKSLFTARNEISHELDLQSPEKPADRTRRSRRMGETVTICNTGFDVCQRLVNAVASEL